MPFKFNVMERVRMKLLIFCLVVMFSFHVYAMVLTMELSTSDGFSISFGDEELRLKVGYPRFGIEGSYDFMDVFALFFDTNVNLNFPATDARSVFILESDLDALKIAVGVGVELRNPNPLIEGITERGRFFIRMITELKVGRGVGFSLFWDRYIFSILETSQGIMFNHYTINDSPLSDNRIFMGMKMSSNIGDSGRISVACGYMMNAGWLRSMEQMGYSLNDFIFKLGISKVF